MDDHRHLGHELQALIDWAFDQGGYWVLDKCQPELDALVSAIVPTEGARYIVIGYGETDHPQAAFVNEREQLLDAVLGMMYTKPSDADDEIREAYRKDLADDEWSGDGIWSTEFEIGGITIYDTGERAALSTPPPPKPAVDALTTGAVEGEPDWITKLRYELIFKSKMTHSFTFSRDEVMQLLAAHPASEPKALTEKRQKFEAWAVSKSYYITRDDKGHYMNCLTVCAWEGWKAALRERFDEA